MSAGKNIRADEGPLGPAVAGGAEGRLRAVDSERGLIAAAWIDGMDGARTLRRAVGAGVVWKAFSEPVFGKLWHATVKCFEEHGGVDTPMVAEWLRSKGKLELVGGVAELNEITNTIPTTAHANLYIERVLETWYRRRTLARLVKAKEAVESLESWPEVQGALTDEMGEVRQLQLLQRGKTLTEVVDAAGALVSARRAGTEDGGRWIPTGLAGFDRRMGLLGSLSPEDHLVMLMGASGNGKSAILRQIAWNGLRAGKRVLCFSRETGTFGLVMKMAGMAAGVNLLRVPEAPGEQIREYEETLALIKDVYAGRSLWSYDHCRDNPLHTVEDLEGVLRRHCDVHGEPDLVVVDYLQQLGTRKRTQSREQTVAEVSHQLQGLSREFRVVMLTGVQVNRSGISEQNMVKRDKDGKVLHRLPGMQDLRESDAPYHDADRVIALYRPPEDCRGVDQTTGNVLCPEMWVCQIKCRDGMTGYVRTWFRKQILRFEEIEGRGN